MLDALRKNSQSGWVQALLGSIVVVFIFWGVGTLRTSQLEIIARVNDEIVSRREFDQAYQNLLRAFADLSQGSLPAEMLREQALDQLITTRLLIQEADRLGLTVSEEELRASIAGLPQFQADGRFNKDLYVRVLRANGMKPADFEASQRQQLLLNKVRELVVAGAHVTEAQARDRYRYENARVDLAFMRVPAEKFLAGLTPAETDVQAYYEGHQEEFREPERVRIQYLHFQPATFAAQFEPTEEDVRRYYEEHLDQYSNQEQVRARHILIKLVADADEAQRQAARQRAEEILARVKAGEDFATLAKEHSQDEGSAPQGGDLGFFGRGQMVSPFEQAAFAMEPGTVSDLVESRFGFHIIKVEEKRPEGAKPIEEVRSTIVEALREQMGRELARERVEKAEEQALDGETLEAIAGSAGLTIQTTEPFSQSEPVPGFPAATDLREAAFQTQAGEVGEVVSLDSGYVLFRVSDRKESYVPELTAVREAVESAVRREQATAAAQEQAGKLLQQLKEAKPLAEVAAAEGLEVRQTGPVARQGGYVPEIGNAQDLKTAAFRLTEESRLGPAVYPVNGDAVIIELRERIPADEEKFEEQKAELVVQGRQQVEGELFTQFLKYLKEKAQIELGEGYKSVAGG